MKLDWRVIYAGAAFWGTYCNAAAHPVEPPAPLIAIDPGEPLPRPLDVKVLAVIERALDGDYSQLPKFMSGNTRILLGSSGSSDHVFLKESLDIGINGFKSDLSKLRMKLGPKTSKKCSNNIGTSGMIKCYMSFSNGASEALFEFFGVGRHISTVAISYAE